MCLFSKLLAPPDTPIADFLSKAPDPPAYLIVKNAVSLLRIGTQRLNHLLTLFKSKREIKLFQIEYSKNK